VSTTKANPLDHSKRKHALCSASSASRWLNCPGSVGMSLRVPEPPSSPYALEGTKMHELCEKLIEPIVKHWNITGSDKIKSTTDMINTKDLKGLAIENYPAEMREHADDFVEIIWEEMKEQKPRKVYVERRVVLDKSLGMFGTADLFFPFKKGNKKILSMYDIKYGKGVVVEPDSPQLIFYALAVHNLFKKVEFDESWLYIFQPRAEHDDGPLRKFVLTKKAAASWKKKLISGAKKALSMTHDKEMELVAGDHCIFCNAKPVCKAHAEYLNKQAGLDFTDDPAVLVPAVSEQREEIQQFMSDEQVAQLLTHKSEIEKFLSSLTTYGINRFEEGDPIPGWKVVEGRSQRRWLNATGQVEEGLKELGVKDPYDKKLRGLGSIEKELKELNGKGTKPAELISSLVTRTNPPKVLVPESDPRPAISLHASAIEDFDVVDSEVD